MTIDTRTRVLSGVLAVALAPSAAPFARAETAAESEGRDSIRKMYADACPKLKSFRGETADLHVSSSGDMAWETGRTFSTRAQPPDAPASSGKYLIVWRRDADGVWRIAACAATANPNP